MELNQSQADNQDEDFILLPQMSPQEMEKLQKQHLQQRRQFYQSAKPYQMENWYQKLQEITFKSSFFSLTIGQAFVLGRIYYQNKLSQQETQIIQRLKQKAEIFISSNFGQSGCFMKLSTRSPKDFCWDFRDKKQAQQLTVKLSELLKNYFQNKGQEQGINNLIYQFVLKSTRNKIRIPNGQYFVKVFSSSQRVCQDLQQISYINGISLSGSLQKLRQNCNIDDCLINVWGRQWIAYEWFEQFRCFYYNYQLTGISQYDQKCFFYQLKGKQEVVRQKIHSFFNSQAKPRLQQISLKNGVIDIVLQKLQSPKIVEINSFDQFNTRGSLFDWKGGQKDILQGKALKEDKKPQVRFLKESKVSKQDLSTMMGMIDKGLGKIVATALNNVKKSYLFDFPIQN